MAKETDIDLVSKGHAFGTDDVFVNEDTENQYNCNLLTPDYNSPDRCAIPRRSSLVKDPSKRSRDRKKTVSFSSMPNEKPVVNAADCLAYMQNGSDLMKVRTNNRQYRRLFTLTSDCSAIRWQPSKKPNKACIPVSDMKEICMGKKSSLVKSRSRQPSDECAFTIIYGEEFECVDFVATSPDEANIWVIGLTYLISQRKGVMINNEGQEELRDKWLQEVFDRANLDKSDEMDELEVVKLIKQLNTGLNTVKIQQKLKEVSTKKDGQRGRISSSEFIAIFKEIATRPEIYFLLVKYASSGDFLTADDLMLFLEAEQGLRLTKERCQEIINQYEPSADGQRLGQLGIDGFTSFLLSSDCDILDPSQSTVCQDMSQPLSHYFIAASHNTYLLEDQLKGASSTDGYVRAFLKGCRYVEVDVWDGSEGEPMIYHGQSLTSKILFKSAVSVINAYAFQTSPYPVIMSLENHCTLPQQRKVAGYLQEILGEKLAILPNNDKGSLPSPEDLRGKILIAGKRLKQLNMVFTNDDGNESDWGYVSENNEMETSKQKKNHKQATATKKIKLCKQLSDLINFNQESRIENCVCATNSASVNQLCSISESTALKLANAQPEDFVNHNKNFLTVVYPNYMRVDSSNFNPQDLWNCGCQLVALNYQYPGPMMDLNEGRFVSNGSCGYILKPMIMREPVSCFSINSRDTIPGISPRVLHVKIISGQNLPKPKGAGARGNTVDPYVTLEVFGLPRDCNEMRTKTNRHNGFNPLFDESFQMLINLPQLALLKFTVLDDEYIGDEFIGQYTIPFNCMQTGYRHLQLRDNKGECIKNCTLFVHIAITNKTGLGRSTRRRMTSLRKQEHIGLRSTAIKVLDEMLKPAASILKDSVALRDDVQQAMGELKQACGLPSFSNIKQCLLALALRISNTSEGSTLQLVMKDKYPMLMTEGPIADVPKKGLQAFEHLVQQCRNLIQQSEVLQSRLLAICQSAMELHDELPTLAQQQSLKGKKADKAVDNFVWNMRLLQGQADLLAQAHIECQEYMQQAEEAGVYLSSPEERRFPSMSSNAASPNLCRSVVPPTNPMAAQGDTSAFTWPSNGLDDTNFKQPSSEASPTDEHNDNGLATSSLS